MTTNKPILKITPAIKTALLAFADQLESTTKQHFEEAYREERRRHVIADRARHLKTRGRARHATRSWQ